MTITAVGSVTIAGVRFGSGASATISPTATGDILVVAVTSEVSTVYDGTCSGIGGGGVTTWNRAVATKYLNDYAEVWWGIVTSSGSATLTAGWNSIVDWGIVGVQQFHSSVPPSWGADVSGVNGGVALSGNYPSLAPAASGELFVGSLWADGGPVSGSTAGFTYTQLLYGIANSALMVWDANAPNPSSPNWTGGSSNTFAIVSAVITASRVTTNPIQMII